MPISAKPKLIEVHILTVTNVSSALIKLYHRTVFVGKLQIRTGAPKKRTNPTMVCVFKVKKPNWDRLSVRWRGGLCADMPQIYNAWTRTDEKKGIVQSGLVLRRPVLRRDVYGPYQCDLIIDKQVQLSGNAQLFIPPVLAQPRMDMYRSPGESLEYICEVIANPPLISPIKWARNTQLITVQSSGIPRVAGSKEDNRISIDNITWTNDRLKIVPLFDEDDATFSCFAESILGNATGAVNLRVKPKIITIIPIVGLVLELIGLAVCICYNPRRKLRKKRKTPGFAPNA
ncbi:hypothetical protein FBUS_06997 [Fasciolopsis buskii]|uniref:Ig-like domain-containing protein n=1 Tax=Fasciolopsis buskii TaxID=27845 RepID=A0A8E0RQE0_9TREM|nr:hypothetical protein FBUS_06997 [Fasciolopsis buski]